MDDWVELAFTVGSCALLFGRSTRSWRGARSNNTVRIRTPRYRSVLCRARLKMTGQVADWRLYLLRCCNHFICDPRIQSPTHQQRYLKRWSSRAATRLLLPDGG